LSGFDYSGRNGSQSLFQRTVKATIVTLVVGIVLLFFWVFLSQIFAGYPNFQTFFAVLAVALVFFTFMIRFTDGTIFKYGFLIGRAFFLIIYIVYATSGGVFSMDIESFHFIIEFVPLLALIIVVNLMEIAKGILQAVEFTVEAPMD